MKLLLTILSIAVPVVTLLLSLPKIFIRSFQGSFIPQLDVLFGWAILAAGVIVWLPVNLALWQVSGRPAWLGTLLRVQGIAAALAAAWLAWVAYRVWQRM